MSQGEPIGFWKALTEECGRLTPDVRRLAKCGGYGARYAALETDEERAALVSEVAAHARRFEESGVWLGEFACRLEAAGGPRGDGRWRLLEELEAARSASSSTPFGEPGVARGSGLPPAPLALRVDTSGVRVTASGARVVAAFDGRLPLAAIESELRAVWPQLRTAGWVQRTRPLSERKVALTRFVCLETEPGTAWRELSRRWNERYPKWSYASAWAMKSDFHRAEGSLTGRKFGLDWHYDPAARLIQDLPPAELMHRVWSGALSPAQEKAFHRYAEWMSLAERVSAEPPRKPPLPTSALREEPRGYTYEHPRPALTVDAVAIAGPAGAEEVLLVRRGREPFKGMWALPGGFVGESEPLEQAARRELEEETGLRLKGSLTSLGTFGDPGRDPRGWVVTAVFGARLGERPPAVRGADDADDAAWHPLARLPELASDHALILRTVAPRLGVGQR